MSFDAPATPSTRYAGLDGLRAVAVSLVVVYHLFPPAVLPGGFIGVDVFFVISGFLITSLLLREHARTGGIALIDFWKRRARRLLPALALVVTVCASAAWIIGGDVLVRLGEQVLGAFTFSYNWISVAAGTGYFGASAPELFRNFWSLAVEEQFYVVWPLVLPLFLLLPRAWGRVSAALLLAAASAVWMAVVVSGGGVTRGYFGTDTHAFGILIGVALAFALTPLLSRATPRAHPVALSGGWKVVDIRPDARLARVRTATAAVGIVSLVGLLGMSLLPATSGTATFPGTMLIASLLSAVAIAAAVWPRSAFGPALDRGPMRWIGDRSYGIYLWHWPLLVLAVAAVQQTAPEAGFPPALGLGVLAVTLGIAELSYRFIEMPVRRRGLRGSLRALGSSFRGRPQTRLGAVAGVVAGCLVVGGTSAAIAAAPTTATAESAVQAGIDALADAERTAAASPAPSDTAPASPEPSASPSATATTAPSPTPTASPSTGPLTSTPEPTLETVVVTGDQVTAIGDSVMLASAGGLLERLPGIQLDAAVSRQGWAGPGMLETLAAAGALRPYVVIALGTNGPFDESVLTRMLDVAGRDRIVVLVNAYAPRSWTDGVNAQIASVAKSRSNVVVADWSGAIGARTDLLAGDRIHPGAEGGRLFADVVAAALQQGADDRAMAQYEREMRLYERLSERPIPVAR